MTYTIKYRDYGDGEERVTCKSESGWGSIYLADGIYYGAKNYAGYNQGYLKQFFTELKEEYAAQHSQEIKIEQYEKKTHEWFWCGMMSLLMMVLFIFAIYPAIVKLVEGILTGYLWIPLIPACTAFISLLRYKKFQKDSLILEEKLKKLQEESECKIDRSN